MSVKSNVRSEGTVAVTRATALPDEFLDKAPHAREPEAPRARWIRDDASQGRRGHQRARRPRPVRPATRIARLSRGEEQRKIKTWTPTSRGAA